MSQKLWEKLPVGLLKKKFPGWNRLDYEVQLLIVDLAKSQHFRCVFCSEGRDLIIEHDHDPEQGDGDRPTIHNVRGLVCDWHNKHLWYYERNERGDSGWDHVSPSITVHDYDDYIDAYDRRLHRLYEDALEKTCPNYWSRRLLLDKFDDWKDWWGDYPWHWGFEEIKEKRRGEVRTPNQFIKVATACMKFVAAEFEKDPNYQPSDEVIKFMFRAKQLLDQVRPVVEARLAARGYPLHEL